MKFSVLMAVYKNDNAEYLRVALKSIYENQSLKPDEIVIVFDGPLTDQLYAVIDDFSTDKQDVVKTVRLAQNGGLGNALRAGTSKCSYEYILRMDADDISVPNRFEKQIAYAETHPDIDVFGTYISEFSKTTDEKMRVRTVPVTHDDIASMGKRRNPMNHVSVCMKKSSLEACGGYKTLLLLEDYYLWLRMIVAGAKLANISESLVYVRVGNGFNSKRGSKTRIEGWRVLQDYMLRHHLINSFDAFCNMIYIKAFVYMPGGIRQLIYKLFLRS